MAQETGTRRTCSIVPTSTWPRFPGVVWHGALLRLCHHVPHSAYRLSCCRCIPGRQRASHSFKYCPAFSAYDRQCLLGQLRTKRRFRIRRGGDSLFPGLRWRHRRLAKLDQADADDIQRRCSRISRAYRSPSPSSRRLAGLDYITALLIKYFGFNIYSTGFNLLSFWGLALPTLFPDPPHGADPGAGIGWPEARVA